MKLDQLVAGKTYTYYPPPKNQEDNLHFPAKVEGVGKRAKIRVYMAGAPQGVIRHVGAQRLIDQDSLFDEPDAARHGRKAVASVS